MRLSQFTVDRGLDGYGLDTHTLVFNTWSGRSLTVRSDDWRGILAALPAPESSTASIRSAIAALAKAGYVVADDSEEAEAYRAAFDETRRSPGQIFPIIAVTSKCNIACTYCYEAGVQGIGMSDEVVDGLLRWFERRIVVDGVTGINPCLFGGEPLMRPRTLFAVMDGLNALARRYEISAAYYCSSNGLLLTDKLARSLAARNLRQIQISLDGSQAMHDARRRGHHGEGSFDQSLRAIRLATEYIPGVTVKVNFDRQNRDEVVSVFDVLVAEGLTDKVDVKLEAIAYQFADSTVAHDPLFAIPPESPELADAYNQLSVQAGERGIRVSRDTAHTTPCMFTSEHGVLVGPDGEIYKCISLVGRRDYAVGTVFDDDYDRVQYDQQMDVRKKTEECYAEKCPYIPVCGGGCSYESAVRTGRYDLRFCTKEFLAEYHLQRHVVQARSTLMALGMPDLSTESFRRSTPPSPTRTMLPMLGSSAGSGCGSACGAPAP